MPSLWTIDITGIPPRRVRNSGIHRFLSAWFAESDDEHADPKCYSLRERVDHRDGVRLVLGLIADRLASLVARIPAGLRIPFGANPAHFGTIAQPPRCTQSATWSDLREDLRSNQWRIWLRSATTFRRSGLDQPWPAPFQILNSLRSRWLLGSNQPLIEEGAIGSLARGIAVTGAEISTEECDWPPETVYGATGVVEWTWVGGPAAPDAGHRGARTVEQLLRLAEFSGIGAYPQHGLGAVDVEARRVNPRHPRR